MTPASGGDIDAYQRVSIAVMPIVGINGLASPEKMTKFEANARKYTKDRLGVSPGCVFFLKMRRYSLKSFVLCVVL